MDIQDISTLISNYAFPIACCVYMAKVGREELKYLTTAVNNLTAAVDKLLEKSEEGK